MGMSVKYSIEKSEDEWLVVIALIHPHSRSYIKANTAAARVMIGELEKMVDSCEKLNRKLRSV